MEIPVDLLPVPCVDGIRRHGKASCIAPRAVAARNGAVDFARLFRTLRDDIDDTAHGLRPVQDGVRTLDDFNLGDLVHGNVVQRCVVHIVGRVPVNQHQRCIVNAAQTNPRHHAAVIAAVLLVRVDIGLGQLLHRFEGRLVPLVPDFLRRDNRHVGRRIQRRPFRSCRRHDPRVQLIRLRFLGAGRLPRKTSENRRCQQGRLPYILAHSVPLLLWFPGRCTREQRLKLESFLIETRSL